MIPTRYLGPFALLFSMVSAPLLGSAAAAQEAQNPTLIDDPAEPDSEPLRAPPPPRGSILQNRPPPVTSGGEDLTSGRLPTRDEVADERVELLVFELDYEAGITFADSYLTRFELTFWEAVVTSTTYRGLTQLERERRLTRAAQLRSDRLTDERAEQMAVAIGATHYLVPRVEIAGSQRYRIAVTLGRAGLGDDGRRRYVLETDRRVDNVDGAIAEMTAAAVQ